MLKGFMFIALGFLSLVSTASEVETPLQTLLNAHQESQVVMIGMSTHTESRAYDLIADFLEQAGRDEDFTTIFIERPNDQAALYKRQSHQALRGLDEWLAFFESKRDMQVIMCSEASSEWAHVMAKIPPLVRELNGEREAPIVIEPMDSLVQQDWIKFVTTPLIYDVSDEVFKELSRGSCDEESFERALNSVRIFGSKVKEFLRLKSINRERATAQIFEDKALKRIQEGEKILVVYHLAHLIRGFELCMPEQLDDGSWEFNWSPSSWFQIFINRNPEWANLFRIVAIDEKSGYAPHGVFSVRSLDAWDGPANFGMSAAQLSHDSAIGLKMFDQQAFYYDYLGGTFRGKPAIDEALDYIVRLDGEVGGSTFANPREHFPELCDGYSDDT